MQRDVRQIYEDRPYPGPNQGPARWLLAPMAWILALWKPGRETSDPERILIAGCGTGAEAFAMRRRFPRAEIVGADFSPRSIALANALQRRTPNRRKIQFLVRDLAARRFDRTLRDFDFVSCHGVLSYAPAPATMLRNLARCLTPQGALYLGVNGSTHISARLRALLPTFGIDMAKFQDGEYLHDLLTLCDAIVGDRGLRLARLPPAYLASDLFGPLIQNLPLAEWMKHGRAAGFHFQASFSSHRELRPAISQDLGRLLMPRSRAEVCELLDTLQPARFHRLLFTRQPAVNPPWARLHQLLTWRPVLTELYRFRLPNGSPSRSRTVIFRSPATNTQVSIEMAAWQIELLRQSDGTRSLRQILGLRRADVPAEGLVEYLYLLHQLLVINLLQPTASVPSKGAPAG